MRAIFLDRDGVICKNRSDHVKSWAEFEFLPEVKESLAALSLLNLPLIIVTNQAAIGRGLMTVQLLEDIHQRMVAEIAAAGGRIDRIFYCPHRPEDGCHCRKPKPGMLQQAASEMGLDLAGSYLVGDAATDIQAGQQVGCHNILVLTGRGTEQLITTFQFTGGHALTISRNLKEAAAYIFKTELKLNSKTELADLTQYQQLLAMNRFQESF